MGVEAMTEAEAAAKYGNIAYADPEEALANSKAAMGVQGELPDEPLPDNAITVDGDIDAALEKLKEYFDEKPVHPDGEIVEGDDAIAVVVIVAKRLSRV